MHDTLAQEVGLKYPRRMVREFKKRYALGGIESKEAEKELQNYDWLDKLDFDSANKDLLMKTVKSGTIDKETGVVKETSVVTETGAVQQTAVVGKTSLTSHFFAFWLVHILVLREMMRKQMRGQEKGGPTVLPLMYEDLLKEPAKIWKEVIAPFCRINVSESHYHVNGKGNLTGKSEISDGVTVANAALGKDSQRQSDHSQANLSKFEADLNERETEMLNEIMEKANLPTIAEFGSNFMEYN